MLLIQQMPLICPNTSRRCHRDVIIYPNIQCSAESSNITTHGINATITFLMHSKHRIESNNFKSQHKIKMPVAGTQKQCIPIRD